MDDVQRVAVEVLERIKPMGTCDFVTEVSMRMPLKIICEMMGVPESQYDFVLAKSNIILSSGDPEYIPEGSDLIQAFMAAGAELAGMMADVGAHKRRHPGHDLTSALVTAELDGAQLTDQELASFFILLLAAGNETTRNAITHGLLVLAENPDQRAIWAADFEAVAPTAVEEIVRWATPVVFMRRTATRDVRVGGHAFRAGDKCILFYNSANRDERVFPDPYRFDVRRDPNFHVGFGGPGPHFCLGAHLARREITVMFRELFHRLPNIQITASPIDCGRASSTASSICRSRCARRRDPVVAPARPRRGRCYPADGGSPLRSLASATRRLQPAAASLIYGQARLRSLRGDPPPAGRTAAAPPSRAAPHDASLALDARSHGGSATCNAAPKSRQRRSDGRGPRKW